MADSKPLKSTQTRETSARARQKAFLAAFSNNANVIKAAAIAGISRDAHYDWLRKYPKYKEAFALAWEKAVDALEAEAARRAFEGTLKPIYNAGKRATDVRTDENGYVIRGVDGKPIGIPASVREYSDTLLIFLLKGKRPKEYRDNVSIDSRFVDKAGNDRPFLLSDADRLIAEADAADSAEASSGAR